MAILKCCCGKFIPCAKQSALEELAESKDNTIMNEDIVEAELSKFREKVKTAVTLAGNAAKLSRASGVPESSISRFVKGSRKLELQSYLLLLHQMTGSTPSL